VIAVWCCGKTFGSVRRWSQLLHPQIIISERGYRDVATVQAAVVGELVNNGEEGGNEPA